MAKLTSGERNSLPSSDFVLPAQRKYPIPDVSHARNALSRAAQNLSPDQESAVRRKVLAKFPGISSGR